MATAPIPEIEEPGETAEELGLQPTDKLMLIAQSEGDISAIFSLQELTKIGADVVADYERDDGDREDWKKIVKDALEKAAQGKREIEEGLPEYRASQVNFPILTVAAMQFHARAYPAICKSGNMVKVKVIGSDKGRPIMGPDGQQAVQIGGQVLPASEAAAMAAQSQQTGQEMPPPQPAWQIPPGAKAKRASRVSDYMNVYLEYRMDDWEADTDAMLMQQPVAGDGFRKVWWANGKEHAAYIPALNVVVPKGAKSLKTTPRITEEIPDVYPYQIRQRQKAGEYRADVSLPSLTEDDEAPRMLLEQHRLMDMDDDGLDEPYIITVDRETSQVLKIEANFGPDSITANDNGPVAIERGQFYVNFPFLPDPKGGFYGIGLGHLLHQVGDIIDTTINQMFDAGHAQIAGGGFFAAGLRLQGNGQTNTLRWRPGEYKSVTSSGQTLRDSIYERTFPAPSAIMFQLLELVLGAAKDISSIKDVITGEASNQGQVGTTLALIEQGLAVFNDIYKRIYRQLGIEYTLHYQNLGKYGGEAVAQDYDMVLDDPEADFAKDFSETDMDIKPVADPSSVTKIQKMARAQFIQQTGAGNPVVDQRELLKRVYEAADVEDIDTLLPPVNPNAPPPPDVMKTMSEIEYNKARTDYTQAQTAKLGFDVGKDTGLAEHGDPPEMPEQVPNAA